MKVIEMGKWKKPWSFEVMCSEKECGAKLLVEEKDVKAVDYESDYYALCAICESSINIPAKELPLRVKSPLDKKRKWRDSS